MDTTALKQVSDVLRGDLGRLSELLLDWTRTTRHRCGGVSTRFSLLSACPRHDRGGFDGACHVARHARRDD